MKKFKNTYRFCNENIDKFILLLRKCIYSYEYMDDWSRFDEEQLPNKSDFCSGLNMEEKVYGLDPVYFLSAAALAWKTCLNKTDVKLELITDVDMLLMIEKGIRGVICHSVYRHAKANNRYMKIYDKNKESSDIIYRMEIVYMDMQCLVNYLSMVLNG